MTATESAYFDAADRIRTIYDRFPDGIDPDFDSGLEELETELSALRFTINSQLA